MKRAHRKYIFYACVRGKDFKKMPGTAEWENWLWMLEIADNVGNYIII